MAAPKHVNPVYKGLYINSFKKDPTDTNPLKNLLGTNGYGAYASGNKIDRLCTYMNQQGYNYSLFYDLDGSDFVGDARVDMTFRSATGTGTDIINSVMPRFNTAGITDRSAVCNLWHWSTGTALTGYGASDGLISARRIIDYNTSIANVANKRFTWLTFGEEEFWNFPYDDAVQSVGFNTVQCSSGAFGTGEVSRDPFSSSADFIAQGLAAGDFIMVDQEWRQITQVSATQLVVDRDWAGSNLGRFGNSYYKYLRSTGVGAENPNKAVDFLTFYYRVGKIKAYLTSFGNGEKMDLYCGFPQYHLPGTAASAATSQLTLLYRAGITRINLTNYTRIPNFSYLNGNYAGAPITWRRISEDIVIDKVVRKVGSIISAESATKNNSRYPTQNTGNNFSGYFLEGRSKLPLTVGTDFRPLDAGGNIVTNCVGCANPVMFAPPSGNYHIRSFQDCWNYTVGNITNSATASGTFPVTAAVACALGSTTYDGMIGLGGTVGTDLTDYVEMEAQIIFDQELIRSLETGAATLDITATSINVTCFGAANGIISVSATGGTPAYVYTWTRNGSPYTPSPSTVLGSGLTPATYVITVTDSLAATDSVTVVITQPTVLGVTAVVTSTDCVNYNTGTITLTGSGGSGSYVYSVYQSPAVARYFSTNVFTGLSPGTYNICVADAANPTCTFCGTTTVSGGTGPILSLNANSNVTCNGGGDGSLSVNRVSGGTPPVIYTLYEGGGIVSVSPSIATTLAHQFTFLPAGNYTIRGTDANGCTTEIGPYSVTEGAEFDVQISNISAPTCVGGTNGAADITITGNSEPYTFTLDYGDGYGPVSAGITTSLTTLSSGNHNILILDDQDCSISVDFVVPDQVPLKVFYEVTNPTCEDPNSGSIKVISISGSTSFYEFTWENGSHTSDRLNLSAGTYTVTIIKDGCTSVQTFVLEGTCDEFTPSEFSIILTNAMCCYGKLASTYNDYIKLGNTEVAECIEYRLMLLGMLIERLTTLKKKVCNDAPNCEQISHMLTMIKEICDCECCGDGSPVTYDPVNNTINIH